MNPIAKVEIIDQDTGRVLAPVQLVHWADKDTDYDTMITKYAFKFMFSNIELGRQQDDLSISG